MQSHVDDDEVVYVKVPGSLLKRIETEFLSSYLHGVREVEVPPGGSRIFTVRPLFEG